MDLKIVKVFLLFTMFCSATFGVVIASASFYETPCGDPVEGGHPNINSGKIEHLQGDPVEGGHPSSEYADNSLWL